MTKIYIAYATTEGQTAKIAEYIAGVARANGCEADAVDIGASDGRIPSGYDGVIIGSSIHVGKHDKVASEFVRRNREDLNHVPSAFFSVSLSAHGDEENAEKYVKDFEEDTGWHPARVGIFGGALPYTQYGFFKRHMMKSIAGHMPGQLDTDISRDYVYTEWDGVERFAEHFVEELAPTVADVPSRD